MVAKRQSNADFNADSTITPTGAAAESLLWLPGEA
jgi:hypothetical protein